MKIYVLNCVGYDLGFQFINAKVYAAISLGLFEKIGVVTSIIQHELTEKNIAR